MWQLWWQNGILHCNCCLSSCWLTWVIISLYSALISLHLDSVSSFVPQDSSKVWEYSVCLEKDHQDGQALNIYLKDRLRAHGLFSLENRRFRGDLIAAFQCLQGDNWEDGARLSTEVHGGKKKISRKNWNRLGCPERFHNSCPCRFYRPAWPKPSETLSELGVDPVLSRMLQYRHCEFPSSLNVVWLCDVTELDKLLQW